MHYLSPSTLLGAPLPSPLDKKAVQLARKQVLADLELSGNDTLAIRGIQLTKGDIIDYFETLPETAEYHSAVENDPILKTFLEDHEIGIDDKFRKNPLYNDLFFVRWMSPYFRQSFTDIATACFKQANDNTLRTLFENPLLTTDEDAEQCWLSIARILGDNIIIIQHFAQSGEKYQFPEDQLKKVAGLLTHRYIIQIQLLPAYRFSELKNRYAFAAMQASITFFNRRQTHRAEAEGWIENVLLIAEDPDLKNDLVAKLAEMKNISGGSGSSKFKWTRLAWLGVFILIKIITCNSHTNSPNFNYNYTPSTFNIPDSTLRKLKDNYKATHNGDSLVIDPKVNRLIYTRPVQDTTPPPVIQKLPDSIKISP